MSDIDPIDPEDLIPPKAPSPATIGGLAWGCLTPTLAISLYVLYAMLTSNTSAAMSGTVAVATATLGLTMYLVLKKRSRQTVILGFVIVVGFWLLMFGLCAGALSGIH